MRRHAPIKKQRGAALWILLLSLIMAGGFAFYRSANLQFSRPQQQTQLSTTLARAKEALIAYAVTDSSRPGSLPCPDLVTDSAGLSNIPGDGKTDFFTTNICPSYVGWLPWVSPLDLPDLVDDSGTRLWYVLAPARRNHISAQPINSDTPTGLLVDGNADIAALIIAARSPLGTQTRPSNNPADYLDGENGNGDDNKYITGPQSDTFNDVVLVITRQELMAAVEKRVANEVKSCLTQHTASTANTDHRYPWPAPLNNANFEGNTGTLFGRVPSTQPSSGLDAQLKNSITKLTESQQQIANAADASQQLAALNALGQNIIEARNLFDAMYNAYNKIKQAADDISSKMSNLGSSVNAAGTRISRSEGTSIRNLSGANTASPAVDVDTALNTLVQQIADTGIDVFPWKLKLLNANLNPGASATALVTSTQALRSLLNAAVTPRTDITTYLTPATTTASIANIAATLAAANTGDNALLAAAQAAATALQSATSQLIISVEGSRVSILSGQVSDYAAPLNSQNLTLRGATTPENTLVLLSTLSSAKKSIETITTGVSTVISARNTAATALATAISAAQAPAPIYSQIDTNTALAISNIMTLAGAIAANEAVDNNVSHTSLSAAVTTYKTARTSFTSIDTATPRPTQSAITPYATTLANAAVNIDIWAKSIAENATAIAPLAKANTVPKTVDPNSAAVLDNSGYKLSSDALASITGKGESAEYLQTYINTPTPTNQAQAIAALAETTALVNALLGQAGILDSQLSNTTAGATPLIWLSSRCDFLLTTKPGWWRDNEWAKTIFYQISAPLMATPGTLTVNGSGSARLVVLAAGKALSSQNRATLTSANFLEDINANNARDGNALTPSTNFINKPPSSTFNDRLAY